MPWINPKDEYCLDRSLIWISLWWNIIVLHILKIQEYCHGEGGRGILSGTIGKYNACIRLSLNTSGSHVFIHTHTCKWKCHEITTISVNILLCTSTWTISLKQEFLIGWRNSISLTKCFSQHLNINITTNEICLMQERLRLIIKSFCCSMTLFVDELKFVFNGWWTRQFMNLIHTDLTAVLVHTETV
jgi:hypothetical protein